jgi:hypothetical protein
MADSNEEYELVTGPYLGDHFRWLKKDEAAIVRALHRDILASERSALALLAQPALFPLRSGNIYRAVEAARQVFMERVDATDIAELCRRNGC